LFICVCAALLYRVALPLWQAERGWREVRARGVLRIGTDPSLAPYSFLDASGWQGFDADLARALSAELALVPQAIPVGFDGRYDALNTRLVDVVISAVSVDPAQTQTAAYSQAYVDAGPRLLRPASASRTNDGLVVAVALGGPGDLAARALERRTAGFSRRALADDDAVLRSLAIGESGAGAVEGLTALRVGCPLLGDGPTAGGRWHCQALRPNLYVAAVRAADGPLRDALNTALTRLRERGELDKLAERWFQ
jgi:polar amino acid transport system substrate-binding protein